MRILIVKNTPIKAESIKMLQFSNEIHVNCENKDHDIGGPIHDNEYIDFATNHCWSLYDCTQKCEHHGAIDSKKLLGCFCVGVIDWTPQRKLQMVGTPAVLDSVKKSDISIISVQNDVYLNIAEDVYCLSDDI